MSRRLLRMQQVLLALVLALVVVIVLVGCERSAKLPLHGVGDSDWNSYRGKWVFINYWAEWCLPCRQEIPDLNIFAQQHAADAVVLGVNFDNPDSAELSRQVAALAIEFPVLDEDPANYLAHKRPSVLPTTVVYNPQGDLESVLVGPQTLKSLRMWLQMDN